MLLGAERANAQSPHRTMIVVAHQDDDINMVSDLVDRLQAREDFLTVYLTSGELTDGCSTYVRQREQGMKEIYAELSGLPRAPDCSSEAQSECWSELHERVAQKTVRVLSLRSTGVHLAFLGFANADALELTAWAIPSLERLWVVPRATLENLALDGRLMTDTYTKDELIEVLRGLIEAFGPTDLRSLDPNRNQLSFAPFEHTDHIHAATFALAALQRTDLHPELWFYRGYNMLFESPNVSPELEALRRHVSAIYRPFDALLCRTDSVTLCGEERACFDPSALDFLQTRRYLVTPVTSEDQRLRTPWGLCLEGFGPWVFSRACRALDRGQRWDVSADGVIQHRETKRCLTMRGERRLGLAPCTGETQQRFYLLSNGQLRAPEARCVTSRYGWLSVNTCDFDPQQAGFSLR